jgi:hypothetical protein
MIRSRRLTLGNVGGGFLLSKIVFCSSESSPGRVHVHQLSELASDMQRSGATRLSVFGPAVMHVLPLRRRRATVLLLDLAFWPVATQSPNIIQKLASLSSPLLSVRISQ